MASIRHVNQIREVVEVPLPIVLLLWTFSLITRHYLITLLVITALLGFPLPITSAAMLWLTGEFIFFALNNRNLALTTMITIPPLTLYGHTVFPQFTCPTLFAGAYYTWKLRHRWGDGQSISYLTVPKRYKIRRYPKLRQIRIDPTANTLTIQALIKMNRSGHTAYEFVQRQDALAATIKADYVHIEEIQPHLASLHVDWRSFADHTQTLTYVPSKFSKQTETPPPTSTKSRSSALNTGGSNLF